MDKKCFNCGINPRAVTKNGKQKSYCRGCASAKELIRHQNQHEEYLAYLKAYRLRPEFIEQNKRYKEIRKRKNDDK